MIIDKSLKNILQDSKTLEIKISNFKLNIIQNKDFMIFEKNQLDLFVDNTFNLIKKIILFLDNNLRIKKNTLFFIKMIKVSISKILKKILKSNLTMSNSKLLEKRLDEQQKFIEQSFKENLELKNDMNKINNSLNRLIENPKKFFENKTSENFGHNSIARVDFYQEENVRLGSELLDAKKKFDILKNELDKYQEQRSNLISKINSVNEAINDTNVLTNVFDNNLKPKIDIVDHNRLSKKNINPEDLNVKIKNIFTK
tara:strand:+ start:1349 stop:2116 length:768 start_codon:yes stop_codon:yes gene_type:complete